MSDASSADPDARREIAATTPAEERDEVREGRDELKLAGDIGKLVRGITARWNRDHPDEPKTARDVLVELAMMYKETRTLRGRVARLERELAAEKTLSGKMRTVVRNAVEFFEEEVAKLGVPKDQSDPIFREVRTSLLPPAASQQTEAETTATSAQESSSDEDDDNEERITREFFIDPESPSGLRPAD